MKWRIGRVVLLLAAILIAFFAVWTFRVPTRAPGRRVIAKARVPGGLGWSPDGRWVQYSDFGDGGVTPGIYVADACGSASRLLQGHPCWSVGWLAAPSRLLVMERGGQWPAFTWRLLAIDPHTALKEPVEPSFRAATGRTLIAAPSLRRAAVWRLRGKKSHTADLFLVSSDDKLKKLWQLPVDEIPLDACWSPDEETLAFVWYRGNTIEQQDGGIDIIATGTGARRSLVPPRDYLNGLAWSPDGKEIAFSVSDFDVPARFLGWAAALSQRGVSGRTTWMQGPVGFFARWGSRHTRSIVYSVRVRDGRIRELLRLPRGCTLGDLAWSPDGGRLAAVCWRDSTVRVFDIPKAKPGDWRPAKEILP